MVCNSVWLVVVLVEIGGFFDNCVQDNEEKKTFDFDGKRPREEWRKGLWLVMYGSMQDGLGLDIVDDGDGDGDEVGERDREAFTMLDHR